MTRSIWPRFEGGESLQEYAQRYLSYAQQSPFDGVLVELHGEYELSPEQEGDWACKAARAILEELGSRGGEFTDLHNQERVQIEDRIEIIDVMAAIVREAFRQARK